MSDRIFIPFRNGGTSTIHIGDWVVFKPHVRRSLYIGMRSGEPNARTKHRFAGLAADAISPGASGRVQVYGWAA